MSPAAGAVREKRPPALGQEALARPAPVHNAEQGPGVAWTTMPFERSGAGGAAAGLVRPPTPPPLSPAVAPPAPRTPAEVATLQAAYGNAAMARVTAGPDRKAEDSATAATRAALSPSPSPLSEPAAAPSTPAVESDRGRSAPKSPGSDGETRAQRASNDARPSAILSTAAPAPVGPRSGAAESPLSAPSSAAAPGPAQLDTTSSDGILQSLAAAPASSFAERLALAKASAPSLQAREQTALGDSYPQVIRPTGLSPGPSPRTTDTSTLLSPTVVPDLGPAPGGGALPVQTGAEVPAGAVPGTEVDVTATSPPSDNGGSWWDWITGRVRSFIEAIPTTDPGLSTSAGPRPTTDISGEADPTQNAAISAAGQSHIGARRTQADAATGRDFGETQVAPTARPGRLQPRRSSRAIESARRAGNGTSPALPDETRSRFDASRDQSTRAEIAQRLTDHRGRRAQFERETQQIRTEGLGRITGENERTRSEQIGLRRQAVSDVSAARGRWRAENQKIQRGFVDRTHSRQADTDAQIDQKLTSTDESVNNHMSLAENDAERERILAERQAAQKRAEIESRPRSFWERVKDTVSSVFRALKNAVVGIFEELRRAVRRIIDRAKALVHEWIAAARRLIVNLIRGFAEVVKAALAVAFAAFPEVAKRFGDWIDRRANDLLEAINRAADALERAVDAVLDAIGAALDAALRILQQAFLAILDALEFLARAILGAMEWLAKVAGLLKQFGAFLRGLWGLLESGGRELIEAAKNKLQTLIDRVPREVENIIKQHAKEFGEAAEKHIKGIWRHLKPGLLYLQAHWWDELKQMVWNLVWPFNAKSPIWKDVPALIRLPGKILESVFSGQISRATDQYLEFWQKINSVLGVFFGWFFIASVLVGAVIGAFFGGAGAIPGAVAGAAFAGEVGEGLLAAMVATELAVIAKGAYDLAFGPGTMQANESAYDRIANSGLTLAITGVMVELGELAADLAKAIIDGVKGIFRGEGVAAPTVEVPEGEPELTEPAGEHEIQASEPTADGHEVEVDEEGEIRVCSDQCDLIRVRFRDLLSDTDPAYDNIRSKLNAAENLADPAAKAKAAVEVEEDLGNLRKLRDWETSGKITGDLARLKSDLASPNSGTRLGAQAELTELEGEIGQGRTPEVRGARPGPDQPTFEVKARTEPFTSEKNAQNFFNDRIKTANGQFRGVNSQGRVVINLGDNATILGTDIDANVARDLVSEALSKGDRSSNVISVVVKDKTGRVIYEGLGD